jgi:spoIIIJ-associated protein
MPWIEKEGRTVEEARSAAIAQAGIPEPDLEIEVIHEGARGLFGLGGEPAVVRVRPRNEARDVRSAFQSDLAPPGQPSEGRGTATDVEERPAEAPAEPTSEPTDAPEAEAEDEAEKVSLSERQDTAMQVGSEMVRGVLERMGLDGEVTTRVAGGTVYIEVFGENMGILIGRGGQTLEALQELVRAGVQRRVKSRQALVVDIEAYWERRRTRRGSSGGRSNAPRGNRRSD